jgi:uncharacterized protein YggE
MNRYSSFLLVFAITVAPLSAQNSNTLEQFPQISVVGHGEVKITPDRATIEISVQSRAATAAAAAADNANKQSAVISAIRAVGIADDQISTTNFSVSPEQRYEPNRAPVITGYVVTNTVVVEVRKISQVGPVLDASLSHGANLISGLNFYSSNTESSRRAAIALAVAAARADAEAAARAAGGTLGPLIEISMNTYSPPGPRPMMARTMAAASAQADTPISPGQETIAMDVATRWRFVPSM